MSLLARTRLFAFNNPLSRIQSATRVNKSRRVHDTRPSVDYASKYADKLQKRAQEKGASVEELRARVKEQERERAKQRLAVAAEAATQSAINVGESSAPSSASKYQAPPGASVRKDSSPVKPLSTILNLERLLSTPHTPAQVSALWTAYHTSRSRGTGRGFICASLAVDTYTKMLPIAQSYPTFVVPVPRVSAPDKTEKGYEFYLMQWAMHDAPTVPSLENFAFPPKPLASPSDTSNPNPRTTTVLFTPLLEYKLRQTFATPYLVLTFYPDLASSHGVVLLRGEITPAVAKAAASPSSGEGTESGEFLLGQQDAQLLAMGVQKFYLWNEGEGGKERRDMLKSFHERPEEFKWEELLKYGEVAA